MSLTPVARRFVAIASIAAVAAACGHAAPPPAPPPTVRGDLASLMAPDSVERYSITIQPYREVDLAFKSGGIVDRIQVVKDASGHTRSVQAGDRVSAGSELGRVRTTDYDQRVAQAQAAVQEAQAQVTQLEALLHQAQQDDERATHLYQAKSLTKPDLDQAEARLHSTAAQVEAARATLKGAQAGLDQSTLALEDTRVRAPFAGWIGQRTIEIGALVSPSTPAFSVLDTHLVKATFAVPDTSLSRVRPGQTVYVWLDAMADRVTGTVSAVAPAGDPRTHVYSVDVTIDNPTETIRPGMVGAVVLSNIAPRAPRLVVPLSAIVRNPSNPSQMAVFRLDDRDGKTFAAAQPVTTGETLGNNIEITAGLTAGQRIVSLGAEQLHSGDEVRVLR